MQINLTAEQSAQFDHLASLTGRTVDELAHAAMNRLLTDDIRYIEGVLEAEAALDGGEFLTHEEVGEHLAQWLKA